MTVYCLELVLCLLYIFFFFYSRRNTFFSPGTTNPEETIPQRLRSGFESSLPHFHDAVTLFTFVILIAFIILISVKTGSRYTNSLAFIIAIFKCSHLLRHIPALFGRESTTLIPHVRHEFLRGPHDHSRIAQHPGIPQTETRKPLGRNVLCRIRK